MKSEMVHHQRHTADRSHRVRPALPSDVRRRTVNRFEKRVAAGVNVRGWGHAETSRDLCGEITDDIAEKVRGHEDFVPLRPTNEVHGHRVDEHRVGLDVRKLVGDLGGPLSTTEAASAMIEHLRSAYAASA